MLFNSLEFLIFLPIVLVIFFISAPKYRWLILLVSSYYFYMAWEPKFISLILISTIVDYSVGIFLERTDKSTHRRLLMWTSIVVNLGILMLFKYNNFFIENVNEVILMMGGTSQITLLNWVLPMGISFYTFQTMAYTIDVYRKNVDAERHFGYFALYVCYFPQLVAGPIERAKNLLGQLKKTTSYNYNNISWGFKQMIWGFFKKVVIADRVGIIVDNVYNSPTEHEGLSIILASYLFAFQIYCDFSGYSDIAIGVSRMFGIDLRVNFKLPYIATSFGDFWKRWHISLSSWFKDYLYIPIGGNRVAPSRLLLNLMMVFLISGFWHGAAWTFIIWGGLHGIYLIVEHLFVPEVKVDEKKWLKLLRKIVVFQLVVFAWIFFRSNSVQDSFYIIDNLFEWDFMQFMELIKSIGALRFTLLMLLLTTFVFVDFKMDKIIKKNIRFSHFTNQLIFAFITATILLFGFFGEAQFIYFQF